MAKYRNKGTNLFNKNSILTVVKKYYNKDLKTADIIDILDNDDNDTAEMMVVIKQHIPAQEVTVETVREKLSAGYINGSRMCRLVAKSTYLTEEDVKNVFRTYRSVIDNLIENDNFVNYSFSIPYFATVQTRYIKGVKAGTEIKMPNAFLTKDKNAKGYQIKVIEEDRVGHDNFSVKIKKEIKDKLRECSEARYKAALEAANEDDVDDEW